MQILKKNFKLVLLALFVAVASCSFTTKEFYDPDRDKLLLNLVTHVLERGHYDPRAIDDAFSEDVFNKHINGLDPLKRYFIASDIEEFSQYKHQIDDQIKNKDLSFFELVYSRFIERVEDVKKIYPVVLEQPFDFNQKDVINVDYDNLAYAKNLEDLQVRWNQQLKFTVLSTYYDSVETQENMKKKNDSTTNTAKTTEIKSLKELEKEARESTKKSLDEYFEFTGDLQRKDYYGVYLNTIMEAFDPHTNYFAPPDKDRFDLQMSGKLEGIGARLQKKNDYITIVEIISGGPAWRNDELKVGDVILKVKQE